MSIIEFYNIDRSSAEKVLLKSNTTAYLIRNSSMKNVLALSVVSIKDNIKKLEHIPIYVKDGKFSVDKDGIEVIELLHIKELYFDKVPHIEDIIPGALNNYSLIRTNSANLHNWQNI